MEVTRQSAQERRKAYLASAIELRKMAYQAHSAEVQRAFMQLAVLYEELAEWNPGRPITAEPCSNPTY